MEKKRGTKDERVRRKRRRESDIGGVQVEFLFTELFLQQFILLYYRTFFYILKEIIFL